MWTYRHAMTPKEMPKKLLVIGSGAIGIEFASFYNDMGVDTTVVEMMDRIVPVEDAEVSTFLEKALTKQGLKIMTGAKTGDIAVGKDGVKVALTDKKGKTETVEFSHVIVAIGIVPNVENIGLEDLGIEPDKRFHIKVDPYGRTNVKGVWAIGDCVEGPGWRTRPATKVSPLPKPLLRNWATRMFTRTRSTVTTSRVAPTATRRWRRSA